MKLSVMMREMSVGQGLLWKQRPEALIYQSGGARFGCGDGVNWMGLERDEGVPCGLKRSSCVVWI